MLGKALTAALVGCVFEVLLSRPAQQGDQRPACPVCKAPALPTYNTTHWPLFQPPAGFPAGVTCAILNPWRENGQCKPPDDCKEKGCSWGGTFEIHNGSTVNLANAQIVVGGVVVGGTGALPVGGRRQHTYSDTAPLKLSCTAQQDGTSATCSFEITAGAVYTSQFVLTCPKCM